MNRLLRTASSLLSATALATTIALGAGAPSASAAGGTSTMHINVLGCDEGANPYVNPEDCDRVLEDDGTMYLNVDHQYGYRHTSLGSMARESDGTYVATDLDQGTYYFTGLEPHNYNNYAIASSTDTVNGKDGSFWLDRQDFAEVTIYYYNGDSGTSPAPGHSAQVNVGLWGCDDATKQDTAGSYNDNCVDALGFDGVEYFLDTETGEQIYASSNTMLRPNARYQLVGFEPIRRSGYVIEANGKRLSKASDGNYYFGTDSSSVTNLHFFYFG